MNPHSSGTITFSLDEYYTPDEYDPEGIPAPPAPETDDGSPEAVAAPYGPDEDICAGVFCPEIDCPTNPYIPHGECCPVCPGASPVRPNLQVGTLRCMLSVFLIIREYTKKK